MEFFLVASPGAKSTAHRHDIAPTSYFISMYPNAMVATGAKMDTARFGPLGPSVPSDLRSVCVCVYVKHGSFFLLCVVVSDDAPDYRAHWPLQGASPPPPPRSPFAETPCVPSSCSGIWPRPLCSSLGAFSFALLPRLAVRAQSHGLDTTGGPGHSFPPDTWTDRGTDPPFAPTSQQTPLSPGHRRILLGASG